MDVTVVVGTYGDPSWHLLAQNRAIPSADALGVPVVHSIGTSLHDARNTGLEHVDTEWVCFLDADDELEPGYFEAMERSEADLRAPSVRYVKDRTARQLRKPWMPRVSGHVHDCTADCLTEGNWLVIGTLVRADQVRKVGGFRDFTWSEDWDLWVRCWRDGASVGAVPKAIYRAHVRYNSRNRAPARAEKLAAHQAIAEANGLPVPA